MSNYGKHLWLKLLGRKFGRLTVIEQLPSKNGKTVWLCQCACDGSTLARVGQELTKGKNQSCGCLQREMAGARLRTHGMSHHPAYHSWRAMLYRCLSPTCDAWDNYGGRGITVCQEWQDSFEAFWRDMGPTWVEGLTLDRIDNKSGNYESSNCRWGTSVVQANNRRNNVVVETPVGSMTMAQASEHFKIPRGALYGRFKANWPLEELFIPTDLGNGYRNYTAKTKAEKAVVAQVWEKKNLAKRTRQRREANRQKTNAKRAAAGLPPKVYKN